MDKFAVFQLEKKRKKIAELQAQGVNTDCADTLQAVKLKMTKEQTDAMNEAYGYLNAPKEIYTVAKQGSAAIWWQWDNPHGNWEPLDPRDSDDEREEEEGMCSIL